MMYFSEGGVLLQVTGKCKLFRVAYWHFVTLKETFWCSQSDCPQIETTVRQGECQRMQNQSVRIIRLIVLSLTPPHTAV